MTNLWFWFIVGLHFGVLALYINVLVHINLHLVYIGAAHVLHLGLLHSSVTFWCTLVLFYIWVQFGTPFAGPNLHMYCVLVCLYSIFFTTM